MKYNIDIFKTPSYQKIFKEVLKLRHPNLSEEEALKEEAKTLGCLFYHKKENLFGLNIPDNILTRCELENDGDEIVYWFLYEEKEGSEEEQQAPRNYICVGRPITISELVDVLNREKEVWYYAGGSIVMMDSFEKENGGLELQECMRLVECELENINFLHELEEETLNEIVEQLD